MLNRRHLRIKVMHILFSFYRSEGKEVAAARKDLEKSIQEMYSLYITYLGVFNELLDYANYKIEQAKNKKLATQEDLNPNLRFVQNKVLAQLSNNQSVLNKIDQFNISYLEIEEDIKRIYRNILASEEYKVYMALESSDYNDDKAFVRKIFKKYIANYQPFLSYFEEKSVFIVDDVDIVCSMILKNIKEFKEEDADTNHIYTIYKEDEEEEFGKVLLSKTISDFSWSSKIIEDKIQNWNSDRLASMDYLLIQMALTEAKEFASIPLKVSLNEYIEIAKYYSTPKSGVFINGVINQAFNELKESGEVVKRGRGLID
jgi:transcription antitermination protein NusB